MSVVTTFYRGVEIESLIDAAGFEVREAVAQLPGPSDFPMPTICVRAARPIAQAQRRPSTLSSATRFGNPYTAGAYRTASHNAREDRPALIAPKAASLAALRSAATKSRGPL